MSASPITKAQFEKLEQDVYAYWPTAKLLPEDAEHLSYFDYSEQHVRTNPAKKTQYRRDEFRTLLKTKVEKLLGHEVAESVYRQLATNHSVSTAQHYVTLTPRTLNATLQTSLAYFGRTEKDRENIIVFGCSGISFNNPWQARGHLFHSIVHERLAEHQFAFFGRAMDADPIIFTPPYGTDTQKVMQKLLLHYRSEKLIKKREFTLLQKFMDEILFTPDVLSQKHYIDQVTISNFYLWKKVFEGYNGHVPNLIFMSQEKLAAELIKEFHVKQETVLHKFLFDKKWHELIYKHFDGIMCAFSVKRKYGTFHFWAMQNNGKTRVQLFMNDGVLESEDKSVQIAMTPENIASAIENDELQPSTLLTFVVLGMYYGLNLSGGLDQPMYLTQTKDAYTKVLDELGMHEEKENVEPIVTNDIVISRPVMMFLQDLTGNRVPASALDLLLYNGQNAWPMIMKATKQVTLKEMFYRLYPELYRDYCEHTNKDEVLLQITERDIERFTHLDQKIPPSINLA